MKKRGKVTTQKSKVTTPKPSPNTNHDPQNAINQQKKESILSRILKHLKIINIITAISLIINIVQGYKWLVEERHEKEINESVEFLRQWDITLNEPDNKQFQLFFKHLDVLKKSTDVDHVDLYNMKLAQYYFVAQCPNSECRINGLKHLSKKSEDSKWFSRSFMVKCAWYLKDYPLEYSLKKIDQLLVGLEASENYMPEYYYIKLHQLLLRQQYDSIQPLFIHFKDNYEQSNVLNNLYTFMDQTTHLNAVVYAKSLYVDLLFNISMFKYCNNNGASVGYLKRIMTLDENSVNGLYFGYIETGLYDKYANFYEFTTGNTFKYYTEFRVELLKYISNLTEIEEKKES